MRASVIIRCQTPSGSYRFHAATWSETPAQPYEEKALSRGLRAGVNHGCAQFKSPGRHLRRVLGRRVFSRCQVAGGLVGKNRTPATINFCGYLSRWSNALLYVCQDAKRGSSDRLKSFAVSLLFHAPNKAWSCQHEVQRKSVSR